jgi:hypothetical protein
MTEPRDLRDDDVLLDVLRHARTVTSDLDALPERDDVPDEAVAAARAAFSLRDLDEELAQIVLDSLHDEPVLTRHDGGASRMLSYTTSRLDLDVELAADGRTILGTVAPAATVDVEIETANATQRLVTDELGRFRAELDPGWCRLRVRAEGAALLTPVIVR